MAKFVIFLLTITIIATIDKYTSIAVEGKKASWDDVINVIEDFDAINNLHFVTGLMGTNNFAFEYIKGNRITGETIHQTASAAKEISISAALVAVDEGFLTLADLPSRFLDWWTTDQSDKRSRVTLGQLMSYTSSLRSNDGFECDDVEEMESCVRRYYDQNEGMVDEPGTTFYYTTYDFQIVAWMVVKATGVSDWIEWFDYALRTPLNLPNTTRYSSITNPSLSGGMQTSHYGYLQWFVPYVNREIHSDYIYNQINADWTPEGRVRQVFNAYSPYVSHYGLGNWLECMVDELEWNDSCYEQNWRSTCGMFGLNPFKNLQHQYYGSIMSIEGYEKAVNLTALLHPLLTEIYTVGSNITDL